MDYYLRIGLDGTSLGVWEVANGQAIRIGVANARNGPGCYFQAEAGEGIFDAIRRNAVGWFGPNGESPFHRLTLAPGEFYGRIARPGDQHPSEGPGHYPDFGNETEALAMARSQLAVLSRQLDRICQTIQPAPANMAAFGHDIRNLLILACTEVESHWRGVLTANGVPDGRFTTGDYVKLAAPMRLTDYEVTLGDYPWLTAYAPFRGWEAAAPTQSLPWYAAYNATKHDRENAFAMATLEHAICAVCANAVMIAAQYGHPFGLGGRSELSDRFEFSARPRWRPEDVYTYPYDQRGWRRVSYPFSP